MTAHTLADAYFFGCDDYLSGLSLDHNPYCPKLETRHNEEYTRGYKVARKRAKFDATIAKRQAAKQGR